MVLTFEVSPEEAKRVEWARAQGFDLDAMLHGLIASLPPAPHEQASSLLPHERAKLFMEWAESHRSDMPILSDEAISRESIYGDRG
jgi:hypothetical protein